LEFGVKSNLYRQRCLPVQSICWRPSLQTQSI